MCCARTRTWCCRKTKCASYEYHVEDGYSPARCFRWLNCCQSEEMRRTRHWLTPCGMGSLVAAASAFFALGFQAAKHCNSYGVIDEERGVTATLPFVKRYLSSHY